MSRGLFTLIFALPLTLSLAMAAKETCAVGTPCTTGGSLLQKSAGHSSLQVADDDIDGPSSNMAPTSSFMPGSLSASLAEGSGKGKGKSKGEGKSNGKSAPIACDWQTEETCYDANWVATSCEQISSGGCPCPTGQHKCGASDTYAGWCTNLTCPITCDWQKEETCYDSNWVATSCANIASGGCPCAEGQHKCGATDNYAGYCQADPCQPPPTSSYMPPTSSYMPPTSSYMPPTSSYMPPTSSYMPPTSSYMPPTSSYMPPTSSYMPPTSSYMPPTSSYMPPTSSYMPPTSSYMPPTSSDMPPTSSYMPPTSSYMPPTSSFMPGSL